MWIEQADGVQIPKPDRMKMPLLSFLSRGCVLSDDLDLHGILFAVGGLDGDGGAALLDGGD